MDNLTSIMVVDNVTLCKNRVLQPDFMTHSIKREQKNPKEIKESLRLYKKVYLKKPSDPYIHKDFFPLGYR